MRIKLDENIPVEVIAALSSHEVDTVPSEGLSGALDDKVWAAAQREGRVLVTQDLDFSDLRRFAPGQHYGIVLLRLKNPSRKRLADRIDQIVRDHDIDDWAGCFVVVSDSKVRIHQPAATRA